VGPKYGFKNRRVYWRVPDDVRAQIIHLAAHGARYNEITSQILVSRQTVRRLLEPLGGVVRSEDWQHVSASRLSIDQRIEIGLGLAHGESCRFIAARIGRAPSTVSREIKANGGRRRYRPMVAHRQAHARARRPKPTKLAAHPVLRRRVAADLQRLWSPEQIATQLRAEFGDDTTMSISHETIYKSLYVQGRGELRRELTRCLRTGRARRKPQSREEARGRIPDMVMISERPAEASDRAVPGLWEGDLIMGKASRSAIGTLVERSTRYVMLLHLPAGKTAAAVRDAMTETIKTLPESLRRSITWDQGHEMAEHAQFTLDTGVQVFFCDPHSPWQRGSNENTNGLLRQYFPKGTDLSVHGENKLQQVADSLNTRPRKTLGWKTPAEKLAELVATTG
jgi:transposase, IS30 family